MAILDDLIKGPVPMLVGLGLVAAAPNVIPGLASGLRPVAKILVRGGMAMFDVVRETVTQAGEQINDLVKEARAEMAEQSHSSAEEPVGRTPNRSHHRRYRG